jgi:hypothetical protein
LCTLTRKGELEDGSVFSVLDEMIAAGRTMAIVP